MLIPLILHYKKTSLAIFITATTLYLGWPARADAFLVSKARAYLGMTAKQIGLHRHTLWCSAFLRHIAGTPKGVNDRAISWTKLPRTQKRVGAIVIVRSKRAHVGVVSGFDDKGNPRVISGNHNNRVAESVYPASRVIAYVEM